MIVDPEPFPHTVIDGLWDDDLLRRVRDEFPDASDRRWVRFANDREVKHGGRAEMFGEACIELYRQLSTPELLADIAEAFDLDDLQPELHGGGMHQIPPQGHLAVHTDFTVSPHTGRHRAINLLIYLNDDWDQRWGGDLELWGDDGPARIIAPTFNRTVIFACSDRSWHGHPEPLRCPPDRSRRSFAVYYYTAPDHSVPVRSTVFREVVA